jgi:RNA polymerase sigma-70 factor, ECF subfamily
MARIQEHDGEALHMLYKRHADLCRSVIRRVILDEAQCEDVLREVFEAIRDRAEHYTLDKGRALGWILTIARQRALQRAQTLRPVALPEPRLVRVSSTRTSGQSRRKGKLDLRNLIPGFGQAAA